MGAGSTIKKDGHRYPGDIIVSQKPRLHRRGAAGVSLECSNPVCKLHNRAIPADQEHLQLGKRIFCLDCKP